MLKNVADHRAEFEDGANSDTHALEPRARPMPAPTAGAWPVGLSSELTLPSVIALRMRAMLVAGKEN